MQLSQIFEKSSTTKMITLSFACPRLATKLKIFPDPNTWKKNAHAKDSNICFRITPFRQSCKNSMNNFHKGSKNCKSKCLVHLLISFDSSPNLKISSCKRQIPNLCRNKRQIGSSRKNKLSFKIYIHQITWTSVAWLESLKIHSKISRMPTNFNLNQSKNIHKLRQLFSKMKFKCRPSNNFAIICKKNIVIRKN